MTPDSDISDPETAISSLGQARRPQYVNITLTDNLSHRAVGRHLLAEGICK